MLSAMAAGLGNSLDSISVFAFLSPALALLSLAHLLPPELPGERNAGAVPASSIHAGTGGGHAEKSEAGVWVRFVLVQALGFTLGFATALAPDMSVATSVALVLCFGVLVWTTLALLVFLPTHRMWRRLPPTSSARLYIFPLLHSTVSVVLLGRAISTFPAPANAVLDLAPMRMLASVFGLMGIDVFVSMSSLLIFHHLLHTTGAPAGGPAVGSQRQACCVLVALLILGGVLARGGSLWQISTAQQLSSSSLISASCLLNKRGAAAHKDWQWLLEQTSLRVAAGDDIGAIRNT